MRKNFFFIALLLLFVMGCASFHLPNLPFRQKNPASEPLRQSILVGLATDAPPMSYKGQGQKAYPLGLEPRMTVDLQYFTRMTVRFAPMPRKALVEALKSKQLDLIMGGFTASEVKELGLAATKGYLETGLTPLTRLGQEERLGDKKGLKDEGVRIGTVMGASGKAGAGQIYVRGLKGKGSHQIFASARSGVEALLHERIDVLLLDMPASRHYAAQHIEEGLMPGAKALTRDKVVWALRPEDDELRKLLNEYLDYLKAKKEIIATKEEEEVEVNTFDRMLRQQLPFYNEAILYQEEK